LGAARVDTYIWGGELTIGPLLTTLKHAKSTGESQGSTPYQTGKPQRMFGLFWAVLK